MSHGGMDEPLSPAVVLDLTQARPTCHGGHESRHSGMKIRCATRQCATVTMGPGVQTISPMPIDRTGEPGQGLQDAGHKVLVYRDLMAVDRNPTCARPARAIEIHLTGNMERYMWSFDGEKLSARRRIRCRFAKVSGCASR
jgi:FtsP/CotA-like multicopper oxidase with cupredoxin domain